MINNFKSNHLIFRKSPSLLRGNFTKNRKKITSNYFTSLIFNISPIKKNLNHTRRAGLQTQLNQINF